ncbi:cytochrome P450 [Mycena floridula]|nr:cytochrome P450 [Mycena floridula]
MAPTLLQCMTGLILVWTVSKILKAYKTNRELAHIPCVGHSGFLSSWISAVNFIKNGQDLYQEGYEKYPGRVFRVPLLDKWMLVVSGEDLINDVRTAPDDKLSILESGAEIWTNPYHVDVVRNQVTRLIGAKYSDSRDEISSALNDLVPSQEEWLKVPVYDMVLQLVTRSSNRFFVGLPLCRDPEYTTLSIDITKEVFITGMTISIFPAIFRPIAARALGKVESLINQGIRLLGPTIAHRLEMEKEYGVDWPDKPSDGISWLLDFQGQDRSVRNILIRLLGIDVAAIHTTSMALTWALYELAAHPEVAEPLRQEIQAITESEGWSKVAMVQMRKLDSFVKESSRIYSSSANIMRKTCQKYTFSDGTTVPAGYFVRVINRAICFDEKYYPNPEEFQPFRFSDLRQQAGESIKHQTSTPGVDHLLFGIGRHACPGRFFALNSTKLALAEILLNYDMRFDQDGYIPPAQWFNANIMPDAKAGILFRKRAT